jgi:hypothetical protein
MFIFGSKGSYQEIAKGFHPGCLSGLARLAALI